MKSASSKSSSPSNISKIQRPAEGVTPLFVHAWIDELGLTPAEFRVLAHVFRRTGSKLNVDYFASHAKAAKICRLSVRSIIGAFTLFEQANIITIQKREGRTSNIRLRPCSEWASSEEIDKIRKSLRQSEQENN